MFRKCVPMSKKSFWRIVWFGWIAYFTAAERKSLKMGVDHAPLSWHLRWVLGVKSNKVHRLFGAALFWTGVVWLWDHLYHGEASASCSDG